MTPERANKSSWVMDAWNTEDSEIDHDKIPKKTTYKISDSYSSRNMRIKKTLHIKEINNE